MNTRNTLAASLLALLMAAPGAFAQGALTGVDDLDDRIDDIQEDVNDDLTDANNRDRLSNQNAQGWTGNIALGLTATSGNTDTGDLDLAGRLRFGSGPWNHTLGFAAEYSEENGTTSREEMFATYDANRYLTEEFYLFGLGSVRYDSFDGNRLDAFLGAGPGYRFINRENRTWRVQAGPGVRYVEDQNRVSETEVAGILSSRHFYAITDTVSLTNDLDILFSEQDTFAATTAALNIRVTDRVSTRISYRMEWDSDAQAGQSSTDKALGVSLVYGF